MKHEHFFSSNIAQFNLLPEEYNYAVVVLSYIAACLAGFCASSIYQYISLGQNDKQSKLLLLVGGIVLGIGIWSMHFIGMLAFSIPVEVKYDLTITLLSVIPAIAASITTLWIAYKQNLSTITSAFTAAILAGGVATMHFIGMTAMNMNASMLHEPITFAVSILISWLLAWLTILVLQDKIQLGLLTTSLLRRTVTASILFGFTVATMHYLAMYSTFFIANDSQFELGGVSNQLMVIGVLIAAIALVFTFSLIILFKRKIYLLDTLAETRQTYMTETIDNMSDPFILCDAQDKVLLVNHSFFENFHALPLEIDTSVTMSQVFDVLIEHIFPFKNDRERQYILDAYAQKQPVRHQSIDGKWWLFRQSLTYSNNRIFTWTNVTQEVQQQEEMLKAKDEALSTMQQLQQTQLELSEAQKLNALAKLVANVAHELNTPIGVAITSLSGLQNSVSEIEQLTSSQQLSKSSLMTQLATISDYEELASRNMNRAASIVQQFKYISVSEYNEPLARINLYRLSKELESKFATKLAELNVEYQHDINDQIVIESYEEALFQVLQTLLNNALQHAFDPEQTGAIKLEVNATNNGVEITFNDSGRGIEQSIKQQIFEPFVSTKRYEGSMGLGLHIVHNIVTHKLNGSIKYVDNDNKGTTFVIFLPLQLA